MKSSIIYKKLFRIHSWLGLISGLFLLLLGVSGSILVFRSELNHLLYDHLVSDSTNQPKVALDSAYHNIIYRYDNIRSMAIMGNPLIEGHPVEFRVYTSDDKLYTIDLLGVLIDPYTGKILREGYYRDFTSFPVNWLLSFHYSFMLGGQGMFITAIFGLTMLASILTGIIVYRKFIWKVILFKVPIKWKNWRTATSDLHRVVGVWALLLNVVIFFTGFWLNRFMFEPASWVVKPAPREVSILPFSIDEKLQVVLDSIPGLKPTYIYIPVKNDDQLTFNGSTEHDSPFFYSANRIAFNATDGLLTEIVRASNIHSVGDWFNEAYFSLHIGSFGGIFVQVLYVIVGLTPGLLSVTGFMLWYRRKSKMVSLSNDRFKRI